MKFSGDITEIKIDTEKFTKALMRNLRKAMLEAALAFLKAASPKVPVLSGQALGSLLPLARLVKNNIYVYSRTSNKKGKGPESGARQGKAKIIQVGNALTVEINTDVIYYAIQDRINIGRSPRAPWRSFPAGKTAFDKFLKKNLKIIAPKVTDFIVKSKRVI